MSDSGFDLDERTRALWVALDASGVVGAIRKHGDDAYTVTMAGADEPFGTFPTMEIAKQALHSRMRPGSAWPSFEQHA